MGINKEMSPGKRTELMIKCGNKLVSGINENLIELSKIVNDMHSAANCKIITPATYSTIISLSEEWLRLTKETQLNIFSLQKVGVYLTKEAIKIDNQAELMNGIDDLKSLLYISGSLCTFGCTVDAIIRYTKHIDVEECYTLETLSWYINNFHYLYSNGYD